MKTHDNRLQRAVSVLMALREMQKVVFQCFMVGTNVHCQPWQWKQFEQNGRLPPELPAHACSNTGNNVLHPNYSAEPNLGALRHTTFQCWLISEFTVLLLVIMY